MTTPTSETFPDIERLARRRAGAKLGWYIHALAFVLVNALLFVLSTQSGRNWHLFPLFGWGLGLAIHGLVVFMPASGLYAGMVARERERLTKRR